MEMLTTPCAKVPIGSLKPRHREVLIRAIANVLSSPIAEQTLGQIVDGLPFSYLAFHVYDSCVCPPHPLLQEHKDLCPGVLEEARTLSSNFDFSTWEMDSQVRALHPNKYPPETTESDQLSQLVHDYQSSSRRSGAFGTRLIELVARAVHQIAVSLYKQDTKPHKEDALGRWRPSEHERKLNYPVTWPTTLFCHPWYRDYDQYPEGIADCVGYWAE
jgi:hypothetical protein